MDKRTREQYCDFQAWFWKEFSDLDRSFFDRVSAKTSKNIELLSRVPDRLWEIAQMLHKLDEHYCNYGLSSRQESRESNLEKELKDIGDALGVRIYHQAYYLA